VEAMNSPEYNKKNRPVKNQRSALEDFMININNLSKKSEFRIMQATTGKYITLDDNGIATMQPLIIDSKTNPKQKFFSVFDDTTGSYKIYNPYFDSELYYYGHPDGFLRVWPPCPEGGQYWNFSIDNKNSGIYFINQDWSNHYLTYNGIFFLWEWATVDTHWILHLD